MVDFRPCAEVSGIACELDQSYCSLPSSRRNCMADVFYRQPEEEQSIFLRDTYDYGYTVLGIEGEILRLREQSTEIVTDDFRGSSWRAITGRHLVEPFPVSDMKKRFRRDRHQSRGSEFHRECPISLLYVVMDPKKLPEQPLSNILSASGNIRHAVATDDCNHHRFMDGDVPRSHYCERDVEYVLDLHKLDEDRLEQFMDGKKKGLKHFTLDLGDMDIGEIAVRGRVDSLLKVGSNLTVLDFKRGGYGLYEKKSNKLQFGVYALAVEQLLQESFSGRILISVNRIRESSSGAFKLPVPHITMMHPGSDLEEKIDFNLVVNYLIRKQFLDDPEFYLWLRKGYRTKKIKRGGKTTTKCGSVIANTPCFNIESRMCDIIHKYVKKGGDMRGLLAKNVSI